MEYEEKIFFANYKNHQLSNKKNVQGRTRIIYTSCCYTDKQTCLIGNNQGKLYIFRDGEVFIKKRISSGTIQNITYKKHIKKIFRMLQINMANEKGNNFHFTISLSMSFFFFISQSSTKVLRWAAGSSLGLPKNCSFMTRFNNGAFIWKASALVAGGIGVPIKSLLVVFEKSHNLVVSWDMVTEQAKQQARQVN